MQNIIFKEVRAVDAGPGFSFKKRAAAVSAAAA